MKLLGRLKTFVRKKSLLNEQLKAAEEQLRQNAPGTQEAIWEWLKHHHELKSYQRERMKAKWLLIIGLASLVILTIVTQVQMPSTIVSGKIVSTQVLFKLNRPFIMEDAGNSSLVAREFAAKNFYRIQGFSFPEISANEDFLSATFSGESLRLRSVVIDSGAIVRLEQSTLSDVLNLYVFRGNARINFQLSNSSRALVDDNRYLVRGLDHVDIRTHGHTFRPFHLAVKDFSSFSLTPIAADSLVFEFLSEGELQTVESSVLSGTINVLPVEESYTITNAESLHLENPVLNKLKVDIQDGRIITSLVATVSSCKVGSREFQHELVPNLLTFLYRNHEVLVLWTAITFIWGLLWSIKK